MDYGFLPCTIKNNEGEGLPGPYPQSDTRTGRLWGKTRSILDEWVPYARKFDLVNSTVITTLEQATQAIEEFHTPLQICSSWGFGPDYSTEAPHYIWVYKQVIASIRAGGVGYKYILNQWGTNAHKPPGAGAPWGGFWVTDETFAEWITKAHCATIGELILDPDDTEYDIFEGLV